MPTIEAAGSADLELLGRLDRHIIPQRLADCVQRGFVYVLQDQKSGAIYGELRYSLFWQSIPFIDFLYIQQDQRGQGFGSYFMQYFENAMRDKGYRHVMLSTQEDETAQFFYEKLGYQRSGSFFPPEQEAAELIFWKKL